MNADELLATLELVRALSPVRTISIETNPNHLDPDDAASATATPASRACRSACRASTTACSPAWTGCEKYGSGDVIRERLAAAQGVFPTLNVDMIFNLPGQTLAMLEHDLDVLQRAAASTRCRSIR